MKTIIFDLDGTLISSHEDVWDCLEQALKPFQVSIPPDMRADYRILVKSTSEILKLVYPDATAEDCAQYGRDVHTLYAEKCTYSKTFLFPGIYVLLKLLHGFGYQLLIVTMKPESSARAVVKAIQAMHFFDGIYAPDSFPPEKLSKAEVFQRLREQFNLNASNCMTVGDNASDVEAAHDAGLPAIAVTWGYGDYPAIENSQPEVLVSSVADLTSYFLNPS